MHFFTNQILLLFLALTFVTCNKGPHEGFLSVDGESFIDSQGRTVILNGINYVTKDPEQYFKNDNDEAIFKQFRDWGFNCVRFGMSWRGIEPEPGKINEAYLKEIDKRVKLAEENNLWVILDMHQDLYGGQYGNGAPDWATFDNNLPHERGDVWSDAYLVSPAIHAVFDNFWNNKPAADGIGIQDHYIYVWKTIAKRYANSPAVAGFDIMNEPFTGSESTAILANMLGSYGEIVSQQTGEEMGLESLLEMWGNESARIEALESLRDKNHYRHIIENAYNEVKQFEEGHLSAFYQRVRDAVREVNKKHILFLEQSYFSNLGVKSSFKVPADKEGKADRLVAYAPHGYDLVTDTDAADNPVYTRVEVIFDQIFEAAKEKKVPVLIGEWGAYYMGRNYMEPAKHLIGIIEHAKAGQTYWAYWKNIEQQDYFFSTIARTYPRNVSGKLISYRNNFSSHQFECEWEEDANISAPTMIYVSDITNIDNRIHLQPASSFKVIPIDDSKSGMLEIETTGEKRKLLIQYQ